MKKTQHLLTGLLFLAGILCISGLIFCSYSTLQKIASAENTLSVLLYTVQDQKDTLSDTSLVLDSAIKQETQKSAQTEQMQSENQTDIPPQTEQSQTESTDSSESENDSAELTDNNHSSVFADANESVSNGYIVGIDPGHQSFDIDMSDMEPIGPGSSEMKVKATTGTAGSYTGLPEYQLNLDISLLLRDILESRGYQVVLTRENNETAISNRERAQLAASKGADIYVRIHANGDDTHSMSGALTMAPSPQNPYVAHLSNDSVKLSQCILDAYCTATGFQSLGVQYYDNMTGINWSSVPVTIVEMGFMTHEYDDTAMSDPDFQIKMAEGIANGIDAYFQ